MKIKSLFVVLMSLCCGMLSAKSNGSAVKDSSVVWEYYAEQYIYDGRYADAGELIKKMFVANPRDGRAFTLTSLLSLHLGKYSTTLQSSQAAIQYLSTKKEAKTIAKNYLFMSEASAAMGDTVASLQCLDKALKLKLGPEAQSYLYCCRGDRYMQSDRLEAAQQDYQKSVGLDPENTGGWYGLGCVDFLREKYESACNHFTNVVFLNKKLNQKTSDLTYYSRAYCYANMGKDNEAVADLLPYYYLTDDTKKVNSLLIHFNRESLTNTMLSSVKVSSKKFPDEPRWPRLLGVLAATNGEYVASANYYLEAIQKSKDIVPRDCAQLAKLLQTFGAEDKALKLIDYAVTVDPSLVNEKISMLGLQDRIPDAVALAEEVLALDSTNAEMLVGLGSFHLYKGAYAEAEKCFQKVVSLYPEYSDGYHFLSHAQRMQGKKDLYMENLRKSVELDSTEIYYAQLYFNDPEAENSFLSYMKKKEEEGQELGANYYNGACFYAVLGNMDKAFDYLDKSLQKGFFHFVHFKYDDDLLQLRKDPRYAAMVKKYKAVRKQVLDDFERDNRESLDKLMASLDEEPIYVQVDKRAEFPGGMEALFEYLKSNLVYPSEAVDSGLQGRVMVRFVVEKNGAVSNVEVDRGVTPLLDAEAVRVIENMPDWTPAEKNGKPCRSRWILPVKFEYK